MLWMCKQNHVCKWVWRVLVDRMIYGYVPLSLSLSSGRSLYPSFSLSLALSLSLPLARFLSGFSPSMYMDAGWLPQCNLHQTLKLTVLSIPYTNLLKPINEAMMHTHISVHSRHHALKTPKARCPDDWFSRTKLPTVFSTVAMTSF